MTSILQHSRQAWPSARAARRLILLFVSLPVVIMAACGTGPPASESCAPYDPPDGFYRGPDAAETVLPYDFSIEFYQGQEALGTETALLSELHGRPTVLNFWAGLCPPCRAEMPEFQAFADEYADRALVIGVDLGQFFFLGTQDDAEQLLSELNVCYPAGYTDDANVLPELGVTGLPATFFIASDGSLHRKWLGVLNGEKLAEITDEMLAQ